MAEIWMLVYICHNLILKQTLNSARNMTWQLLGCLDRSNALGWLFALSRLWVCGWRMVLVTCTGIRLTSLPPTFHNEDQKTWNPVSEVSWFREINVSPEFSNLIMVIYHDDLEMAVIKHINLITAAFSPAFSNVKLRYVHFQTALQFCLILSRLLSFIFSTA